MDFKDDGYDVAVFGGYKDYGLGSIRAHAVSVHNALETFLRTNSYEHVTVIGHSMGGFIARYLVQVLQVDYIDALVTLGTPHTGTSLARFLKGISASCEEMNSGSVFLKELNEKAPPITPTLNVTGGLDFIGKTLHFGENISVPRVTHLSLVLSPRVYQEIWAWLTYELFGENGPYSNRDGSVFSFFLHKD